MESIIKTIEGDLNLDPTEHCKFCLDPAVARFGIITSKRFNGHILIHYPVCKKHLEAINNLLIGSRDIDTLIDNYKDLIVGRTINLRA